MRLAYTGQAGQRLKLRFGADLSAYLLGPDRGWAALETKNPGPEGPRFFGVHLPSHPSGEGERFRKGGKVFELS